MEAPLIAIIVVGVVLAVFAVCLVILAMRKKPEDIVALKSKVDEIASIQSNLVRDTLTKITSELEVHKKLEEDIEKVSRNIERVVTRSRARGSAGENILAEALSNFPPEMVRANFNVKGHQVEYALVLADKNYVPIDSKWTTPELIQRLDLETDAVRREEIVKEIKKSLSSKVKDITKYIDPSASVRLGIAAVPDPVFDVCGDARLDAYRDHQVIVMPYSLTIIYLLSLYQLNLQYYRSFGVQERLEGYLNQLERDLEKLDKELENSVSRGATMIENAFRECKQIVREMRDVTAYLKAPPAGGEAKQIESVEKGEAENNSDKGGV